MKKIFTKLFGSRNDRILKAAYKTVADIRTKEDEYKSLPEDQFAVKTQEFKDRLTAKEDTLGSILPEAFALASEAAFRALGMRPYDVQLIGGIMLHSGKIAEMATGEGKTLTATLPAYLNSLTGGPSQIVTVNDYLAYRDASTMKPLFKYLGTTVGVVMSGLTPELRQECYGMDVTYVTNSELGFDYLRDNMAMNLNQKVQRGFGFAIVDEVDSILIDEARTPLIVSGAGKDNSELFVTIRQLIADFEGVSISENEDIPSDEGVHFTMNEADRNINLTEEGHAEVEQRFHAADILKEGESLYSSTNAILVHYVKASLRAEHLYKLDVDYMIRDGEVLIIDESTGRAKEGRRWGEGLHQAIEAKEDLTIQPESQTMASVTYQNLFKLYDTLSGMTGTADTEAFELHSIYGLEVMVLPTNEPSARRDDADQIFLTMEAKFNAVMVDVEETHASGQPLLIGTASVEDSEYVSAMLTSKDIKHDVLNAKNHEREAEIIAQAGRLSAVTIATNMAGRGTDIVLGGNADHQLAKNDTPMTQDEHNALVAEQKENHAAVIAAGGLRVISTERNESRRVDNQLRGRSGRQGDVGSTQYYLSFEDDLMRLFASDQLMNLLGKLGIEGDDAISHPMISRAVENAQKKLEGKNYEERKSLVDYDDVYDEQRHFIYEQRDDILAATDITEEVAELREKVVSGLVYNYCPAGTLEETWSIMGLQEVLWKDFNMGLDLQAYLDSADDENFSQEQIKDMLVNAMAGIHAQREEIAGSEWFRYAERYILLQVQDNEWREHLSTLDALREGIHLRSFAQKDPKQEFRQDSFDLFGDMIEDVSYEYISQLSSLRVRDKGSAEAEGTEAVTAEDNTATA